MNNNNMKLFSFNDVFAPPKRGQRLIEADQADGEIAYISSTKMNNGISAYINPPDFMTRHRNKLTLSNSGSVGYCFFHDYDFVASDHVTVIGIKDENISLNENVAMYLRPVFECMRYKYNFGREISDGRLAGEHILLPSAKGKPDWDYMANYILCIKEKIKWAKIPTINTNPSTLNKNKWVDFEMSAIFDFYKGERLVKAALQPGKLPFIGAISSNNGVRQLVDADALYDGNCITVNYNGSVGEAFYQESPFWASDDVNVLYPKSWWVINRNIAMFLVTVIRENRYLYSYGRKWNTTKMKKTKLKLPAKGNKPDFKFMEQYISTLQYADRI
jgi:hypothetical protein